MREEEVVAFVMMMFTVGFIFMVFLITRYLRRKLEHREILAAIEHGQPLPLRQQKAKRTPYANDLRTGTLLVNFAIGFGLFVWLVGGEEATAVALVPLFIGLGYLINAVLGKRLKLDNGNGNSEAAYAPVVAPVDSAPEAEIGAGPDEEELAP